MELPEGVCSSDSESVESEVESKSCEEVEPLPPKKEKVGLTIYFFRSNSRKSTSRIIVRHGRRSHLSKAGLSLLTTSPTKLTVLLVVRN